MTRDLVVAAASNNAAWCDAVCRAHGRPGEFAGALWLNRAEVPPFYPNVVTLLPDEVSRQVDEISTLVLPGHWGVKDSFATLDLASRGFTQLFSAQWIHYAPTVPAPACSSGGRWARVRDVAGLTAWETAWSRPQGNTGAAPVLAVFRPGLLEDASVRFLAAYLEGSIVAGAIAYLAAGVVSLSNTFLAEGAPGSLRMELLGQVVAACPGVPVVGYEHGDELAEWCTLGFEPIGPLRVWLRDR
ncbi:hypothetical protein [Archangium lipolyticum]|uniref:hypothetical protein n=1 Tax=Archangium lipolyticum TaxID=2970465 RepID=UPI00214A0FFE|nr:hypothetical protein [Archangium lipolyticum]